MWKKLGIIALITTLISLFIPTTSTQAQPVTIFTPYTGLTASPGETITYNVDLINNDNSVKSVSFDFNHLPKNWTTSITANGNTIKQLSVKPGGEEQITVEVSIPTAVKENDYRVALAAKRTHGAASPQPLRVSVTEEGTSNSHLPTEEPSRAGHADST